MGNALAVPSSIRLWFRHLLEPLARGLLALKVSPNTLTLIGLVPALAAGFVFAKGMVRFGGVLGGISRLFDLLARTGRVESRGIAGGPL